jgi:hypothetical protein
MKEAVLIGEKLSFQQGRYIYIYIYIGDSEDEERE